VFLIFAFKPHHVHNTAIATDNFVAWCVCMSVMRLRCAKTAEQIDVVFTMENRGGPRHIVLDGGADPIRPEGSMRLFSNYFGY